MPGESSTPDVSFKVLTLNTHKGFTPFNRRFVLHELREAVRTLASDVVFLQEVLGSHDAYSLTHPNWPTAPQYEFLADTMWSDFAYGRNAVYTQGHHGNALLSKFPILRYENYDISIAGPERRGLLHSVLRIPGHSVDVHTICTHLSLSEPHRRQQMKLMCELVNDAIPSDVPLLIAGDFNDWRLRAHASLGRCAGMKEAFVETHGEAARTFPARWPVLRLDRIYFRNLRVLNSARHSARPWSHLSDHAALTAEVHL